MPHPCLLACLALAAALAGPSVAHADDLQFGVGLAFKTDGVTDSTNETLGDNVGTNRLYYAPLSLEVRRRLTGDAVALWLRGRAGTGVLTGLDSGETTGLIVEGLVGVELRWCPGRGHVCGLIGVDAGMSHGRYSFNSHDFVTTAAILEPELGAAARVSDRLWLELALGGRGKRLLSASHEEAGTPGALVMEPDLIVGYTARAAVTWSF